VTLRDWANEIRSAVGLFADEEAPAFEERRRDPRHDFIGHRIAIRSRRTQALLHLKDISCHGAAGISDTPFAVGDTIFLQLRKPRFHAAQVRWVRNVMIGFEFLRPIDQAMVDRLHAAYVATRCARAHEEVMMWMPFAMDDPLSPKN